MTTRSELVEKMARALEKKARERFSERKLEFWFEDARATLSAIESAGWKCVPVEPSEGMLELGTDTQALQAMNRDAIRTDHENLSAVWSAMLSAVK